MANGSLCFRLLQLLSMVTTCTFTLKVLEATLSCMLAEAPDSAASSLSLASDPEHANLRNTIEGAFLLVSQPHIL